MTEFERQVAEAIAFCLDRIHLQHRLPPELSRPWLAVELTPNVAAAIRAAYEDGHGQGRVDADAEAHDDEAFGPDPDSKAALAALRGGPTP